MDTRELQGILNQTTVALRKGEEVESRNAGGVEVTEVFAMPHEGEVENLELVDCYFITVGVDKRAAEENRDDLIRILKTYPEPERLASGPSYIEVGGVIGDQGGAFRLFALGKVLRLWDVITPEVMGINDPSMARELAGVGMVMITGFNEGL